MHDRMIRSGARPSSSAAPAERSALSAIAWRTTASAPRGSARRPFSSISSSSSSGSSEPPLTPMRTGFAWSMAACTMVAKLESWRAPRPTLPGLMRYLARASAQSGNSRSSVWPL